MKRSIAVFVAALLLISLSSCTQKWEYKVVHINAGEAESLADFRPKQIAHFETTLNELGKQGWELVDTYTETETAHPNFGNSQYVTGLQPNVRTSGLTLLFKKEK